MAQSKRKEFSKEYNLMMVAEYDHKGYSQVAIAKILGVSQPQISMDLREIRRRYSEQTMESRHSLVLEKVAQYRQVRAEAWRAWVKSKEDANKEVTETHTRPSMGRNGTVDRKKPLTTVTKTSTKEGRLACAEYMRIIMDCLKAERELLGIDQPLVVKADVNVVHWDALTQSLPDGPIGDEVEDKISALLGAHDRQCDTVQGRMIDVESRSVGVSVDHAESQE